VIACAPTLKFFFFWEYMLTDESSTYALLPVAARYMLLYLLNCAMTLCHAIRRQSLPYLSQGTDGLTELLPQTVVPDI
jgi:hypothetical protein